MNEESLFAAVLEKPTHHARLAHLESACANDPALLQRMNRLLASHEQACGILDRTNFVNGVATNKIPVSDLSGSVVGQYVLKEMLGEGGFGQVFVAEQYHPIRREVAVKLIKPGMNSREVLARFEGERQALALMDHGNIARVFDAGTTEEGHPYFVMELVRGAPITEYADTMQLITQARLKLFSSVCLAVHHAHQKGILHRDLKPSNVLVTRQDDQPVVKVIDFGVAKAVHQPLINDPFVTHVYQMIGTPAYMSPEQADIHGHAVDTRTDIYSLGVLLYELLVGATPFDRDRLRSASYDEMRRIIREEEPLCPSTRICELGMMATTVSSNRQANPRVLSQLFRGELDWIVMKAMEKDRERRYSSASEMARDLHRYLQHEPVEASPPSRFYRTQKFVQRNRGAVLSASIMLLLLVAGVVGTSVGLLQAREAQFAEAQRADAEGRERQRAERAEADAIEKAKQANVEANIATGLVEFFTDRVLNQASSASKADSSFGYNPDLTVREALDRSILRMEKRFTDRPDVEGKIRFSIGKAYHSLGQYDKAISQLNLAVALFGHETKNGRVSLICLGNAYRNASKVAEAIELHERLRENMLAMPGSEHPDTLDALTCLAMDYEAAGRFQEAQRTHQQVYESRFRILGPQHPYTLDSLHHLSSSYIELKNPSKAVQILEELCEVKRKVLGHDHPDTLASMRNLGVAYHRSKNFIQSLKIFEQLLPMYEKVHGKTYSGTYRLMVNLGVNYGDQGRYQDAIRLLKQTYLSSLSYPAIRRLALRNLFFTYLRAGNKIEAKALVTDNLSVARKWSEPGSKQLANDLIESGGMFLELCEWFEPVPLLHEALVIWQNPPIHYPNILIVKSMLGSALLGQAIAVTDPEKKAKLLSEAEALLHQSYKAYQQHQPVPAPAQRRTTKTIESLIQLYTETNKPEEVKKWQAEKARRTLER